MQSIGRTPDSIPFARGHTPARAKRRIPAYRARARARTERIAADNTPRTRGHAHAIAANPGEARGFFLAAKKSIIVRHQVRGRIHENRADPFGPTLSESWGSGEPRKRGPLPPCWRFPPCWHRRLPFPCCGRASRQPCQPC